MMISIFARIENIDRKGENAGYYFEEPYLPVKTGDCEINR